MNSYTWKTPLSSVFWVGKLWKSSGKNCYVVKFSCPVREGFKKKYFKFTLLPKWGWGGPPQSLHLIKSIFWQMGGEVKANLEKVYISFFLPFTFYNWGHCSCISGKDKKYFGQNSKIWGQLNLRQKQLYVRQMQLYFWEIQS